VAGFPGAFSDHLVPACCDDSGIGVPKVAERPTTAVCLWHQFPEFPAAFFASASNETGNYLPGSAAKGYPNPAFLGFAIDKRPQFIQLQNIALLCWKQRLYDLRKRLGFFLSS